MLKQCAQFSRNIAVLTLRNLDFDPVPRTAARAGSVEGFVIGMNFFGSKVRTARLCYDSALSSYIRVKETYPDNFP